MNGARPFLTALLVLVGGCEQRALDSPFVGEYRLKSRDGQGLPASTSYPGQACSIDLLSAQLDIRSSAQWSETVKSRQRCGESEGPLGTFERQGGGTVTYLDDKNDALLLRSEELDKAGVRQVVRLRGQELELTLQAPQVESEQLFVYERVQP
jgi:hypothetical protein